MVAYSLAVMTLRDFHEHKNATHIRSMPNAPVETESQNVFVTNHFEVYDNHLVRTHQKGKQPMILSRYQEKPGTTLKNLPMS